MKFVFAVVMLALVAVAQSSLIAQHAPGVSYVTSALHPAAPWGAPLGHWGGHAAVDHSGWAGPWGTPLAGHGLWGGHAIPGIALSQGPAHAGLAHAGLAHAGLAHAGLIHPGLGHAGLGHAGLAHAGLAHAGLAHAGLAHAGLAHAGLAHAGLAHAGLAHGAHGPGVYVAKTRGAVHTAPLAGHIASATSVNVAPAPGTH